jgi:hypothetical protein
MIEESGMRHTGASPSRGRKMRAGAVVLLAMLVLGGGAIAWKMQAEGGATGGVDPEREVMREELARVSAAESVFVKVNRRYAATVSELATPVTSRIVVFASARDGYHVRMARPDTPVMCEVSSGRFAAGHSGWQMVCGTRTAGDRLVDASPAATPGWIDRIRAVFKDDCDAACRQARLRDGVRSPEQKQLDQALDQL